MMLPHEGMIGGTPAPIKDKIDSVIIAEAQMYVACTVKGASVLGKIWRQISIGVRQPQEIAAST